MKFLQTINYFFKQGGLKLKFIGFTVAIIIVTISILSTIIINFMSNAIEKKAFDVAFSSINHLGNSSKLALLERNNENKINLAERLKELKDSKIEGFLNISIYEHDKKNDLEKFRYLTGYEEFKETKYLEDKNLIKKLSNVDEKIIVEEQEIISNKKKLLVYRFVKPIIYTFKEKKLLLGVVILDYDKEAIYKVINKAIMFSLLLTFLIIIISIVFVYKMGLRFTKPILTISDMALKVAKGNLDVNLKINSKDEIGQLARSFNHMVNGLLEREKMQRFVSNSTIDMIQSDRKSQLSLGGEYRNLTFLFSDIRGFTAMSETKEPKEVIEIVNFYLDLQTQIIEKNGGDIDKFVGDEVMASFSGEDGISKAINAAIEIQKTVMSKNKIRRENGEVVCSVGIGINKGEVIVGNIGSHERMDFTSIGSEVNLAARLCSYASANEILVEKNSMKNIGKSLVTIKKEPIEVKGFSKAIEINSISYLNEGL